MWRQSHPKSCKRLSDTLLGHDRAVALRQSARLWIREPRLSPNGDRMALVVPEKSWRTRASARVRVGTAIEDGF